MSTYEKALALADYTASVRRHLHQMPELGLKEFETSRFLSETLRELGYELREGIAKTGLYALFDSGRPGKTVLLRFDMDALPVLEETGLTFASKNDGCMHACGHDGHMAVGLSLAKIIAENPELINGKAAFVFQPAEEICLGAKTMIEEGLLDEIKPDFALATHLWAEKPYGWVGVRDGGLMAGSSDLTINVHGKGGHGGKPENTIDPLLVAAHMIVALQSVVSRSLSANQAAVLSIGKISASDQYNIIANKVSMKGTIRWFDEETRALMHRRILEITQGIAQSFQATAEVEVFGTTIPVNNDPLVAGACREGLQTLIPDIPELDIDSQYRTMLSEDFSYFAQKLPSTMLLIGAGDWSKGEPFPHHHSRFDIQEKAMTLAVAALLESLKQLTKMDVEDA